MLTELLGKKKKKELEGVEAKLNVAENPRILSVNSIPRRFREYFRKGLGQESRMPQVGRPIFD